MKIFTFGRKEIAWQVKDRTIGFWHNKKKGKAIEVKLEFDCTPDGINACKNLEVHLSMVRDNLIYQLGRENLKKEMIEAVNEKRT